MDGKGSATAGTGQQAGGTDPQSVGERLDTFVASRVSGSVPSQRDLPRYVAPVPTWLENVAFRLVWLIVAINLAGTAFGFYYYAGQLSVTPLVMWPIVPVSPLATLYLAISLTLWKRGYDGHITQLVHMLAFFGCLKYGFWAAFAQIVIEGPGYVPFALWQFLIWSHVGMILQAFLITRYADFPVWAIALTTGWYVLNDMLDFFIPVLGGPHHTWLNELFRDGSVGSIPAFDIAAAAAVFATVAAVFLAMATRIALLRQSQGEYTGRGKL